MTKDVALLTAGRLAQAFISVAALRIMTTLLSPGQIGSVFVALSIAGAFGFFMINPVGMYVNRRLHSWHENKILTDNLAVFNLYVVFVSVISAPFVYAAGRWLHVGASIHPAGLALMVTAYLFFNTWNMTLVPSLNMLGYRGYFVVLSVATAAACLGASVLSVSATGPGALNWLSGQIFGFGAAGIAALLIFLKVENDRFSGLGPALRVFLQERRGELYSFALPLAGATIFMWLQQQGYRLVVEREVGAVLGYLGVGLGIAASLGAIVESLVQQIFFPGFYKALNSSGAEGRKLALLRLSSLAIPAYVMLCMFTAGLSFQLTGILTHKKFAGAALFAAFGAFLECFRMTGNIIAAGAHSEMRTRTLIKPYAAGAGVSVLTVYAACLMPNREMLIPAALCAGGCITLGLIFLKMKKLTGVSLPWKDSAKAALLASPLAAGLLARHYATVAANASLLAIAGAYLLAVGYLFFKPRLSDEAGDVCVKSRAEGQ